jgi:RNA polymerase sigma-70 factor (ECF subfamily)
MTLVRSMDMAEENILIKKILAGDADAYRQLVERYQTGLIIHCENIIKDRADAADIAQEAFVKAYYQLERFDADKGRFSTWLYRIGTNLALDFLRKNKRVINVDEIEAHAEATMPAYLEDDKQTIRSAIAALEPPKYGEIIRAYFWDGKSYQDIAKQYGTSTNTIGTWMHRAKAQLKEKLV